VDKQTRDMSESITSTVCTNHPAFSHHNDILFSIHSYDPC